MVSGVRCLGMVPPPTEIYPSISAFRGPSPRISWLRYSTPGAGRRPAQPAAWLGGAVALVIGSMTNPAAWNGLFWLILGLVASRPLGEESPVPTDLKTT